MAKYKKDLLIPLLPSTLTDKSFNECRPNIVKEFKTKKEVELSLKGLEGCFGISLNTIIINKKLIIPHNFVPVFLKNGIDELDRGFFEESKSQFKRSIYYKKEPLKITFLNECKPSKKQDFYLFINSSRLKELKDVYINNFTLTTFNPYTKHPNYVPFSNIEVINLSKQCAKIFNEICKKNESCKDLEELHVIEVSVDSVYKSMDDTFRSIQFWGNPANYDELNDDARDIIKSDICKGNLNNMYYFYSIVTNDYKNGLLRRHYENIVDVIGHCQSASKAYFDIFYGNVCLEVTIKPKYKTFEQMGHDSEEFRIWEILALQKHLVKKTDVFKLGFNNLYDVFFDFSEFTKKLEKGGSWIDYAKYLQKITGIEYHYKKRKREFELKEREKEKTLQKLNILLIVSIFISLVTFFLTPIYSSIKEYPIKTFFEDYIFKSHYPEGATLILSIALTVLMVVYIYYIYGNK